MKTLYTILLTLFVALPLGTKAQEKVPLKLIATTPLPELKGDLEFFSADLKGNRLFLCAEDGGTVEVFDLRTGERIRTIRGFRQPHDIVYLPESNNLIVSDGDGFGMVELVSANTYKIVETIQLPPGVDDGVFNPVNKSYYVASGSHEPGPRTHLLNIIDTETFKHVGDITLPGNHSSGMVINHSGNKLYVNLRGVDEIGVVDLDTRQVIARWPITGAHVFNSIALDEINHRLFTASHTPPRFFVLDADTGKSIATLPCTSMNDHMSFDVTHKRIYVTGTDTASVFEQRDADHYEHIAEVPTGYRAKTSLLVPELNRFYVALSGKEKPGAKLAVSIYEPEP